MNIHQSGVTIKEAARVLGVSEAAVRQRLLRRTLSSTRQNGRVFVLLPEDTDLRPPDDTALRSDDTPDDTVEPSDDTPSPPLVFQLRGEIAFLRDQLSIKDRQISELHVMLQTAQRQLPATIPDAPQASEHAADDGSDATSGTMPQRGVGRERTASQPRSWWRRLLDLG